jgi:aspartyl-tRNA(Asn)/glutamyl-tRNA(Gln) amidotransferase subunit C
VAVIDREVVRHIARLARLRVEPDQEERLVAEMGRIVAFVDVLARLPEAPHTHDDQAPPGALRGDDVIPSEHAAALLDCAPDREADALRVPTVLAEP